MKRRKTRKQPLSPSNSNKLRVKADRTWETIGPLTPKGKIRPWVSVRKETYNLILSFPHFSYFNYQTAVRFTQDRLFIAGVRIL